MAVLASSSQSIAERGRRLTPVGDSRGMARSLNLSAPWFEYRGEIWTDARGYATVRSPAERPGGSGDAGRRSISDVHNTRRK